MADVDPFGGLQGGDRDAAAALTNLFKSYGLESLAPAIIDYIKQGYSPDTITILLQDTKAYKDRFKANDVRLAKGLSALSPAEYLATEQAYRQTLQKWGLPSGFYDSPADFQKFLENDLSPVELDQRAQDASDFMNSASQEQMAYYKKYYTQGDLVAFALDPERAAPLVGKAFKASQIGGLAQEQGIAVGRDVAESLAGSGVTDDQARSGFSQIAQSDQSIYKLGDIYGTDVNQEDLINAVFNDNPAANKKIKKLASQERAAFGGASGIGPQSLASGGSAE